MEEEIKNELGIETLKEGVKRIIDLGEDSQKALEDGRIKIGEGFTIGNDILGIYRYVRKKGKTAIAELEDVVDVEKEELVEYAKSEYDHKDGQAEVVVDAAIAILLNVIIIATSKKLD